MPEDRQVREGPGKTGLQNLAGCGGHLGFQRGRDRLTGGQLGMPEPSARGCRGGGWRQLLEGTAEAYGRGSRALDFSRDLEVRQPLWGQLEVRQCVLDPWKMITWKGVREASRSAWTIPTLPTAHGTFQRPTKHPQFPIELDMASKVLPAQTKGGSRTFSGVQLLSSQTLHGLTLYPPVPSSCNYREPPTCPQLGLGNEKSYRLALSTGIRQST